ncbi:MAG: hypothetical protein ABW199_01520 [Caulobacterales bacterium]
MTDRMTDEHIELTPEESRQAGLGTHLLVILGISTLLAIVGLFAFFMTSAAIILA